MKNPEAALGGFCLKSSSCFARVTISASPSMRREGGNSRKSRWGGFELDSFTPVHSKHASSCLLRAVIRSCTLHTHTPTEALTKQIAVHPT